MTQHQAPAAGDPGPYILSFVGGNANGILTWWTNQILSAFGKYGLGGRVIDMTRPDWRSELADVLVVAKPQFCFSFQGFGMNLKLDGQNYWSLNRIPFLSYLGDNPYHAPALHSAEGPGLQMLYSCLDFLQTYKAMDGSLYATTIRYGYPENPRADCIPWADRSHRVVYVKTGVASARLRAEWDDLPRSIAHLLNECSRQILTGTNETVTEVCAAAFEASHLHVGSRRELFLSVCSKVDFYVRAVRAERMVLGLLPHEATIVGNWSHLDLSQARARFHDPVPADTLDPLYANSKIVINTSPSVRHGMHERIMAGLFAKAAVVSDTTPFLSRLLEPCPSFIGLEIDDPAFPDELDDALARALADPGMPSKIARSALFAQGEFGLDSFVAALFEQIHQEGHRRSVEEWWAFPPGEQVRRPAPLPLAS